MPAPAPPHPRRPSPRRAAATAVAVLALMLLGAPGAWAHDSLVSSSPADGAVLEAAPASIDLVMSEPAQALGTQVSVVGADGQEHAAGAVQLVDTSVSQPVDALPAGDYRVTWRVTSSDGHPISGELGFTVSAAAATPAPAAPEPSMTTQATPESSEPSEPSVTRGSDADPVSADGEGTSPVDGVGGAVLALVALGAVVAVFVLMRRRQPPQD